MSRGLGVIERRILAQIEEHQQNRELGSVLLNSWTLAYDHRLPGYRPVWDFEPSWARRKAVVRAMHSFVRKYPQYALMGGQGRRLLYLYEPADPLSTRWAQLSVERGFVALCEARLDLNGEATAHSPRLSATLSCSCAT